MKLVAFIFFQFIYIGIFAQGKWTAVMTAGSYGQYGQTVYGFSGLETFIRDQAKKKQVIQDVVYMGDDKWYAITSYKEPQISITWKWAKEFPEDFVRNEWKNGKHISEVAWGNDNWLVIMTTKEPGNLQRYNFKNTWAEMERWIKDEWAKSNYNQVTQLTYGNGKWFCAMVSTQKYQPQKLTASSVLPTSWIQGRYDEKYNIDEVESDGKYWYVIMTKKPALLGETIFLPQETYPSDRIKTEYDKNRRISTLVYSGYKESKTQTDLEYDAFLAYLMAENDELSGKNDEEERFNKISTSAYDKLQAKNYKGAIDDYEKAVKIKTNNVTAWNNLAWAKYLNGSCETALNDVNRSLSIKSMAYNNHTKASILKCQNKCAEALTFFNEAIRLLRIENGKVDDAQYYADRAETKRCMGNYSGAVDDLELALSIEPNNADLKMKLKEVNKLAAGI